MKLSMKPVLMCLLLCTAPAYAQQSLTPPGMPTLRPVPQKPVEEKPAERTRGGEDESLSFSVPSMRGGAEEEPSSAPSPASSRPSVTTRPVASAGSSPMPPLNVAAGAMPPRSSAVPAASPARPVAAPTLRPSRGAQVPSAAQSEREEIEALDRDVARARAALPAASQGGTVSGGQIPPSEMTVKPGQPVLFNIARQHLNRIVTPFASPFVKTTSPGTTATVEGRVVYIATANPAPVSLFIGDDSDPVNALAVTVVPRDIPAVQVTLKVEGYEPSVSRPIDPAAAEDFELSQPFLQTIRELFRTLATGEIPSGYGMAPVRGAHPMMPDCPMTGIRLRPMQEISGSQMVVLVARADNVGSVPAQINEEMCASDSVVAIAAWPRRELAPGQSTEVFIALRRGAARSASQRPSTLMGN